MSVATSARPGSTELLRLLPEEVHIWRAHLDVTFHQDLARCLSEDELDRANRFHRFRDRRRYVVARTSLRTILSRYVDDLPRNHRFTYGPFGKPALASSAAFDLRFNVSHSGALGLFAIANGREVGIDVEEIVPHEDVCRLAERFFSRREVEALVQHTPVTRLRAFYRFWTRKEAYIKARGSGLTHPLETFDVLSPRVRDEREPGASWWVSDLPSATQFAAALVVEDGPAIPRIHLHSVMS